MKGNEAVAEAAIRAGCRFFAGYPITPQNEIPEYMSKRLPEVGGVFVQGESEIASINMVYGAAAVGTRALTSSSSPGISLKSEGISYLAGAELPAVIINVTRGGPGLGSIQAAQMDYLQATKASGHGGFRMLVYAPETIQEACDLTVVAFEKAEEYQAPMLICMDGCIGAMMQPVVLPEMKAVEPIKLKFTAGQYINPRRKIVTSLISGEERQEIFNKKLAVMYERWKETELRYEMWNTENAEIVLVAYGICSRVAKSAILNLREMGINVGLIRPITLFPFPEIAFEKLNYEKTKLLISIELSIPPQMVDDIRLSVARRAEVRYLTHSGGILITAEEIVAYVMSTVGGEKG